MFGWLKGVKQAHSEYKEILEVIRQHDKSDPRFADELRVILFRQQEIDEAKKEQKKDVCCATN